MERNREQHTTDFQMGIPWETVTLTALGRNKQLYFDMLEEGKHVLFMTSYCLHIIYLSLLLFYLRGDRYIAKLTASEPGPSVCIVCIVCSLVAADANTAPSVSAPLNDFIRPSDFK